MTGLSRYHTAMIAGTPKEYWSAAELAELCRKYCVTKFSQTERGWQKYARSQGWNEFQDHQCRKRQGRGGGLEYHYSLFHKTIRALIEGEAKERHLTSCHEAEQDADARKIEALKLSALPARARMAMEARAQVLDSIGAYGIAHEQTRAWAVARFLKAQDSYRECRSIEARRDEGFPLTEREAAAIARPCPLTSPIGFEISVDRLKVANDRRNGGMIKRATIYNWFKARDEHGVAALAPVPSKTNQPLHSEFSAFLKFYAIPSKPSASDALGEYHKKQPDSDLKLHQVRYILRHRLNNIEKNVGREGLLTLRARLPYVTRTTEEMWPSTIYTADGKTFDAEIADPNTWRPIRPEITTILDVVTRKVVGIALSRSENTIAVTEALRNSCVGHGIPAIFYVDRGPGYKNKTFDADVGGLMGRLCITKMHAAPYGSQAKGRIERPNATIWDVLAKRLPTYIGQDMDKEASDRVHKQTRAEIKEFGRSQLLPTWDEFVKLCEERVAEYNAAPHRGLPKFKDPETGRLRHMSPDECWAAYVADGFEPVEVSQDEVDDLFRPYELRVVNRGEVTWRTNSYFDHALRNYHGEKVMVGYDYHQAEKVWIREFDVATGQPGPLICVAEFMANAQRYVPRSYQQEAEERRAEGRIKRKLDNIRDIEAERDSMSLLEHQDAPVIDLFAQATPAPEPELVLLSDTANQNASGGLVFKSDEHLAAWALDHPNELTEDQIGVLMECMSRSTARELFRMSGIDTEALRTLLRAVSAENTNEHRQMRSV